VSGARSQEPITDGVDEHNSGRTHTFQAWLELISALGTIHRHGSTIRRSVAHAEPGQRCKRFDTRLKPEPGMLERAMLFAAKCYWPGVTEADLETIERRAASAGSGTTRDPVRYLGSLLFTDDELVLCFFEGPSRPEVKRASDRAGIPSERLMGSIWLGACQGTQGQPSR
jgi:hypothetical protein